MLSKVMHPGEILKDELEELGVTSAGLARQIDVPTSRLSQIIAGKRSVTGDTALRLAHWFGTDPLFWMTLQAQYDLELAKQRSGDAIACLPRREQQPEAGRRAVSRRAVSKTHQQGEGPSAPSDCQVIGSWRITESDNWDREYLDLEGPARLVIQADGQGEIAFGCVQASLDIEYSHSIVFFRWAGSDEGDEVVGTGSAELMEDGSLEIELSFFSGDEAVFGARRA
ncbi:MAG: HigA family addiction module antitoxin [Kiloniellales bacterium]